MLSSRARSGSLPSPVGYLCSACTMNSSTIARPIAIRARCCLRASGLQEEFHLDARELDDVVVLESVRRRADLLAVDVGARGALDVGDEVALRPPGQDRDLNPGLAEGGERLGELELLAGVRAGEELDRADRLARGPRRGRRRRRRGGLWGGRRFPPRRRRPRAPRRAGPRRG